MTSVVAPAKINLFLHVGPVRSDGLHEIASLFVFADRGDVVSVAPASALSLEIVGPHAESLKRFAVESNLVMQAAKALQSAGRVEAGAAIVLDKRLPIASGVGGGSADAAATLLALMELWNICFDERALRDIAFNLGADVPACLHRCPIYVAGAGERISAGPTLPPLSVCLVNPRVDMPTGPVFRAFDGANPAPPAPRLPSAPPPMGQEQFADWLNETRNDLEVHAAAKAPIIESVKSFLASAPGCIFARMSGSGATVFGLFTTDLASQRAAEEAQARGWWAMSAQIAK
jgi:4-diphosphocytidyl-2-C-methyl-D-erythritol kinase